MVHMIWTIFYTREFTLKLINSQLGSNTPKNKSEAFVLAVTKMGKIPKNLIFSFDKKKLDRFSSLFIKTIF